MDLVFLLIITSAVIPAALFAGDIIRIVLGIPYVLFFTGYALVAAIFIRKGDLSTIERLALSLGLSIVVVPLIGLILNYTPWGIRSTPVLTCVTIFVMVTSAFAIFRRQRLPKTTRFEPAIYITFPHRNMPSRPDRSVNRPDRSVNLILALSIVVTIGLLIYAIVTVEQGEKSTPFYILGKPADYPRQLVLGEQAEVTLGIVNEEQKETIYSIVIRIDGDEVGKIGSISLNPGEKWEQTVTFIPLKLGEQEVDFWLFKTGTDQPYRKLQIWVNVEASP